MADTNIDAIKKRNIDAIKKQKKAAYDRHYRLKFINFYL